MASLSKGVSVLKGIARFGGLPILTTTSASSSKRLRTRSSTACAASGESTSISKNGVSRHKTPVLVALGHVVVQALISSVPVSSFSCQPFIVGALPLSGNGQ
jgi:hypothetical protein